MDLTGKGLESFFAPPERLVPEEAGKVSMELKSEFLIKWYDAIPASVLIINKYRQIVYCNKAFGDLAHKHRLEEIIGLRPGEALDCVNAGIMEAGCGCSELCATCGAAQAIVKSLNGVNDIQDCRLTRLLDGTEIPLDLQVYTSVIDFHNEQFVFLFAMDISHELRLRYLNRMFHHGLINAAGGIATLTELVEAEPADTTLFPLMIDSSRRMMRDVVYARDLAMAEQNKLAVSPEPIAPLEYFQQLVGEECGIRNMQPSAIELDVTCTSMTTDKRILWHVVRNMLSNALEARESAGGLIRLGCHERDNSVTITITNDGEIAEKIKGQIFKRYISTKSRDRGLGTYVMKLFGEQFLNGKVSFTSSKGVTAFSLTLPVHSP